MASLVLSTRLAMHNLLRQNGRWVTKVNFPLKVARAMFMVVAGGNAQPLPLKFYDSPDSLMTLSVIIAFLSIMKVWQFQHYCVAFVKKWNSIQNSVLSMKLIKSVCLLKKNQKWMFRVLVLASKGNWIHSVKGIVLIELQLVKFSFLLLLSKTLSRFLYLSHV